MIQNETNVEASHLLPICSQSHLGDGKGRLCFLWGISVLVVHAQGSSFLRGRAPLPKATLVSVFVVGHQPILGADGRAGLQTPSPCPVYRGGQLLFGTAAESHLCLRPSSPPPGRGTRYCWYEVYMIFCSYTWGALETLSLLPLGSETRNQKSVSVPLGRTNSTLVCPGALEQVLLTVEMFGFFVCLFFYHSEIFSSVMQKNGKQQQQQTHRSIPCCLPLFLRLEKHMNLDVEPWAEPVIWM